MGGIVRAHEGSANEIIAGYLHDVPEDGGEKLLQEAERRYGLPHAPARFMRAYKKVRRLHLS